MNPYEIKELRNILLKIINYGKYIIKVFLEKII